MAERKERCGTCRWWVEDVESILAVGQCHRFPPTIIVMPHETKEDPNLYGVWVETSPEAFCGEWKLAHWAMGSGASRKSVS